MKSQGSSDSQHTQWALSQKSPSALQGRVSSWPRQASICNVTSMTTQGSLLLWRCVAMDKSLCVHDTKPCLSNLKDCASCLWSGQEKRLSKWYPIFSKSVLYIQEAEQEQKPRCTVWRYLRDGIPIVLNAVCFSMHMRIKATLSSSHLILSPFPIGRLQSRYQGKKKEVTTKSGEKFYCVLLIYAARKIWGL